MCLLWTLNTKILPIPITDRQVGFSCERYIYLFFCHMPLKSNSGHEVLSGFSGVNGCAPSLPPQRFSYL